ncbi:RNA polymerase sigma factor [Metaplanococcus flavidus]|uniref:RNA polymerase sigma-70 region 2 domain-containing protein n=1 Tax=Metaplanococcus flavidus TaxID=569883 RepID=A0ABW3L6F9_9BACL
MQAEEHLIKALLQRDKDAFEKLYDRYHLLLWKLVSETESDQRICEQLVTQVFKQVWRNPHEFVSEKRLALLLIECCRAKMKERARPKTVCQTPIKSQACCG